jgi:hypothetical protein
MSRFSTEFYAAVAAELTVAVILYFVTPLIGGAGTIDPRDLCDPCEVRVVVVPEDRDRVSLEPKEDVTHLVDKRRSSEAVRLLLRAFEGGEERRMDLGTRYVLAERGFEALLDRNSRVSKLVFHSAQSPGFHAFPEDRLPENISFSDTQNLVRARLGEPAYGDERWDRYERAQYVLDIEYGDNSTVLRISVVRPDSTLPHPHVAG